MRTGGERDASYFGRNNERTSDDKRERAQRLAGPPWTTSDAVKALRGGNPLGSTNKQSPKFIWVIFVYVEIPKGFESWSDVQSGANAPRGRVGALSERRAQRESEA